VRLLRGSGQGIHLHPCQVTRPQKRMSGPLLDPIDIHTEVPRVAYERPSDDRLGELASPWGDKGMVARIVAIMVEQEEEHARELQALSWTEDANNAKVFQFSASFAASP
jgi:predicted ATPase with chaperone activity